MSCFVFFFLTAMYRPPTCNFVLWSEIRTVEGKERDDQGSVSSETDRMRTFKATGIWFGFCLRDLVVVNAALQVRRDDFSVLVTLRAIVPGFCYIGRALESLWYVILSY